MSLLLALLLLVHGSIHIGYVCSRSWPFEVADPWPVTVLGASPETVQGIGTALAVATFLAFMMGAGATAGLLPRRAARWLVGLGAAVSAAMLVLFITPWTLPGLAIDLALLWAALGRGWTPAALRFRGRPARIVR